MGLRGFRIFLNEGGVGADFADFTDLVTYPASDMKMHKFILRVV